MIMNVRLSVLSGLCALALLGMTTACEDDKGDWPMVDGNAPTIALEASHIQSEVGRTFHIKGKIADADGIKSINLKCPALYLDKTIDIIGIYEEPLKEYDLDYQFTTETNEVGDAFVVEVTVIDVADKATTEKVSISMDGDFVAPVFTIAPPEEMTVLIKENPTFDVTFTVTDNRGLASVKVAIDELSYLKEVTEFADPTTYTFQETLTVPSAMATYVMTVTVTDLAGNSVERLSKINVSNMPDFSKMWLSDVETAAELNSDVFGVPMLIDHVGEYLYDARYYNAAAGTKIFFIPQRTDFTPICFGLDPNNSNRLVSDPAVAKPIVLDQANVYYHFRFNIATGDITIDTYSVEEAIDPIPHPFGSYEMDIWENGSEYGEFYFGYMTDNPRYVDRFTQDPNNPHRFWLDTPLTLDAGYRMAFIIHNYHQDGWWNYCTWRADNEDDPEVIGYYGNFTNPAWTGTRAKDLWIKPTVAVTGKYKLYFDAHLSRAKLVPYN